MGRILMSAAVAVALGFGIGTWIRAQRRGG
jgi:hypothetical protein